MAIEYLGNTFHLVSLKEFLEIGTTFTDSSPSNCKYLTVELYKRKASSSEVGYQVLDEGYTLQSMVLSINSSIHS